MLTSLCLYLGTTKFSTRAFHQYTNCQVERYNKTPASRLRLCIAGNQENFDIFVKPVTHAYNCQVSRFTIDTPFLLDLSQHTSERTAIVRRTVLPSDAESATNPFFLRQLVLLQLATMYSKVSEILPQPQTRHEHYFEKRQESTCLPGWPNYLRKPATIYHIFVGSPEFC